MGAAACAMFYGLVRKARTLHERVLFALGNPGKLLLETGEPC